MQFFNYVMRKGPFHFGLSSLPAGQLTRNNSVQLPYGCDVVEKWYFVMVAFVEVEEWCSLMACLIPSPDVDVDVDVSFSSVAAPDEDWSESV